MFSFTAVVLFQELKQILLKSNELSFLSDYWYITQQQQQLQQKNSKNREKVTKILHFNFLSYVETLN